MQQESLAAKASRKWKPVVTPAAKRSAPVLPEGEQDMAAPAKMPRVVPGVVLPLPIAGGLAAAGAAQALAGCKQSRVAQQEPRLLDQVAAPCKVTILRVTKHLDRVTHARPMVWQANSVSTTPAVKELQPNDGVILAVSTSGKEVAEGYMAHIATKLPPPAVDTQALPSKYVCFAVAAVKEVHRPAGGAAADTGTWVELEPASLVWTNTPWQQMIDDMGVPDKAPTTSRTTEKQANIAVEVRHYAQQVGALLSRAAAAHAGAAASGRRLVGRLAPCPTGRFLRNRKAGVQPAAAAAAGSAARGKQGHDSSSGHDDSGDDDVEVEAEVEAGIAQQQGAAGTAAAGGVGVRRSAAAAAAAAMAAPLPAPPAVAVTAAADAAAGAADAAGAGPSNAGAPLAPPQPPPPQPLPPQQQPQQRPLAAEEERLQRLMRGMDVCLQSKEEHNKALAAEAEEAKQQAAAAAADAERRSAAAKAEFDEALKAATAGFEQQRKAQKEHFSQILAEVQAQAARDLAAAQGERDDESAARATAEQERDAARVQLQEAERARAEATQQRDAAVAAATEAEAAKAQAQAERDKWKSLYDTLSVYVETKTVRV
ncbi:hypothetical protein HXX76_012756 [Chlamydomonas incerta]|uniref:Uncharacterized protein n=1 Tax=Chlamydomonas incerta TaxID=51695 RepID=A0A835VVS4_CHLIN|nr:hypothetical protein HXX76_012756 [Chlamydomonas incerta]|eukprot:KAG2426971.1 hypothetical protein HXX76_012756 [Chlamydomonas incerta]